MLHALTVGGMVLAATVASNGSAQAGLFDSVTDVIRGDRRVAQADRPLPAPRLPTRVTPASNFTADEQPPIPVPDTPVPAVPVPDAPAANAPIALYPCVTYDDRDEMHPCAVPVIVCVPDPSSVKHPFYWLVGDAPRNTCGTGCDGCTGCSKPVVYVEICVPPNCSLPEPRVSHNNRQYTYDFGKYSVDVTLKRGEIEVEYED